MDSLAETIHSLRERTDQVTATFLRTELEVGYQLCHLTRCTCERRLIAQYYCGARDALDAVSKFVWKAHLEPHELDQLTAQVERLKFELDDANSISDEKQSPRPSTAFDLTLSR
jgi:hypothetical protein